MRDKHRSRPVDRSGQPDSVPRGGAVSDGHVEPLLTARAVGALQRTAGNAAVQRILVARSPRPTPHGGPFATGDKYKLPDTPGLKLPEKSDPDKALVELDDQDAGYCRRVPRGKVRARPDYVDNAVVSVGVSKMEFWTATIEEFDYRFGDRSKPPLKVPLAEIDFSGPLAAKRYIKSGGVVFPIAESGQVAFDDENTPRMARGAMGKLDDAQKVRAQRRQAAATVMSFQLILAQLALAALGTPSGGFGGGASRSGGQVLGGGGGGGGGGRPTFSFASSEAWIYEGRMIRVVNTPTGPRAFYRRTGKGGTSVLGAQPGDWVPFLGFRPHVGGAQFVKPPSAVNPAPSQPVTLLRWGNEEAAAASHWIHTQHRQLTPLAIDVGENWGRIQRRLQELGVFVEFPI